MATKKEGMQEKSLHYFMKATKIICAILISFFKAVTEVAWGLASIFLLLGLIVYFKADVNNTITPLFLNLTKIIFDYMGWFVLVFFIFFGFRYIKEAME